jgi:hypothetical protein
VTDEVVCDNCGATNMAGANFCNACGTALLVDEPTSASLPRVGQDSPDSPGTPQLVVTRGPLAGARYALSDGETTLGRHPDSSIFLDDVTVSRRHAKVVGTSAGRQITDVGSLNGTYVDGERVESADLREGAQIQIGKFRLVYVIGSAE